jgi:hypothetical protein
MSVLPIIAGLTLAAGFAQLCTGHLGALLSFSMVQGVAVVLALLAGGWFGAASIVLVLSVVMVPLLFRWMPALHGRRAGTGSRGWGLVLATAGAALAVQIPVVGLPFAILLAGLVAVGMRPEPGPRVLGLLAMQHAITLAACLQGEADGLTILVAALPIVPIVMVVSMTVRQREGVVP